MSGCRVSALGRVWAWVRLAAASLGMLRPVAPSERVAREQRLIAGALSGGDAAVAWEALRGRADFTGRNDQVTCPVCRVVVELRAAERSGEV